MAITNIGGVSGGTLDVEKGTPTVGNSALGSVSQVNAMGQADFTGKMAALSNKDLTNLLGSAGLSDARKADIANELQKRFDSAKAAGGGSCGGAGKGEAAEETDDEKRIKELLKKLASGKTLTTAESKELTGLLSKSELAQDTTAGGKGKTPLTV